MLRTVLFSRAEPFPTVQTLPEMKVLLVSKFISFNSVLPFSGVGIRYRWTWNRLNQNCLVHFQVGNQGDYHGFQH